VARIAGSYEEIEGWASTILHRTCTVGPGPDAKNDTGPGGVTQLVVLLDNIGSDLIFFLVLFFLAGTWSPQYPWFLALNSAKYIILTSHGLVAEYPV
jgi:hypothetical protein